MNKYYYHTSDKKFRKKITKIAGLSILLIGILITTYIFFPLISWQIYFAPAFASSNLNTPIPRPEVLNPSLIGSIISQASIITSGIDYTNAENWFSYSPSNETKPRISLFTISIPRINIKNAIVSTVDTNLSNHLINYPGTSIPADKGNSVIFGHSTLPQLFNPKNYKTIFANVYLLKENDLIYATVENITYKYRVYNISVVDPKDTSIFTQDLNDSYITLVTCTPPGTIWKRLIIKARLEKI